MCRRKVQRIQSNRCLVWNLVCGCELYLEFDRAVRKLRTFSRRMSLLLWQMQIRNLLLEGMPSKPLEKGRPQTNVRAKPEFIISKAECLHVVCCLWPGAAKRPAVAQQRQRETMKKNIAILSSMRSIDISVRVKIFVSVRIREGSDSCRLEPLRDQKNARRCFRCEAPERLRDKH